MLPTRGLSLSIAVGLTCTALVAAGCGSDDDTNDNTDGSTTTSQATTTTTTETTDATARAPDLTTVPKVSNPTDLEHKPRIAKPTGNPPPLLVKKDLVVGKGRAATTGDTVTVHYVGTSFSTGDEFDSSWKTGQPFTVQLGQGQVIPGWDQGLVGMKAGGRRVLVIPPELGYGASGQGDILPNETLVFVVDMKSIA